MIISTLTMAAVLLLWFRRIFLIAMSGVITPITPVNMFVMSIICSAILGNKIHRDLS